MRGAKSNASLGKDDNKFAVRKQKVKRGKDPNKPKRPPSAFLVFMEEFRQQYKESHPDNKSVGVVGRAAGVKWRSMTEEEKGPYLTKADDKKEDYDKKMVAYQLKLGGVDEESDKSKCEVKEEVEEDNGEGGVHEESNKSKYEVKEEVVEDNGEEEESDD